MLDLESMSIEELYDWEWWISDEMRKRAKKYMESLGHGPYPETFISGVDCRHSRKVIGIGYRKNHGPELLLEVPRADFERVVNEGR
jgi:hypothetical protein